MSVRLVGTEEFRRVLGRVHQALDPEEVADEVGAALLNRTRRRFLEQVDPDGNPWPQSAAAQSRSGGGTLFDTGALFRALQLFDLGGTRRAIAVDPDARNPRTGKLVTEYAVKHQQGQGPFPQRAFLGFSNEDEQVAIEIVQDRLKRAGG